MPVEKVGKYWRVRSYSTKNLLAKKYKTKKAAQNRAATSKRRSQRKRSKDSKRAKATTRARRRIYRGTKTFGRRY